MAANFPNGHATTINMLQRDAKVPADAAKLLAQRIQEYNQLDDATFQQVHSLIMNAGKGRSWGIESKHFDTSIDQIAKLVGAKTTPREFVRPAQPATLPASWGSE